VSVAEVRVTGLAEALAELRAIDPKLRRAAAKELRAACEPVRSAVARAFPAGVPMSGWDHDGRTGWRPPKVKVQVSGRKKARGDAEEIAAVRVVVHNSPAAEMYDMAAKGWTKQGKQFVSNLNGSPSRVAWPAAEGQLPAVTAAVLRVVENIADRANVALHQYH
jgi:hypothetical protein